MSKLVAAAFVLILAVSMAGCVQTEETDDIIVEEFIVKEVQAPEVLIVEVPEPNVYVETPINKSNDFIHISCFRSGCTYINKFV